MKTTTARTVDRQLQDAFLLADGGINNRLTRKGGDGR